MTAPVIPSEGEEWNQWRANNPGSSFREKWEEQVQRVHQMYKSCGMRVARYGDDRTAEVVPA